MISPGAYCYLVAGLLLAVFAVGFLRDPRRLRIGVWLTAALVFGALGSLFSLASVSPAAARLVLLLFPAFVVALAVFLVADGVTVLRREGLRPANFLSLAAGLGLGGFITFYQATQHSSALALGLVRAVAMGVFAYVAFAFCCYLVYSFVYGRIVPRPDVDFVVVLGCGLIGRRVPRLLASRLDRAVRAYHAATRTGRRPMVLVSGGQGPGEEVSEARAMGDYLVERGLPADRVLLEERSRNTIENLTFSKAVMDRVRPEHRCVVVTNNFHVLRAALFARRTGVRGQVVGSPTTWYFWPNATIREFVAIVVEHWQVNCWFGALVVLLLVVRVLS